MSLIFKYNEFLNEKFVNKFDFELNKEYDFYDLPKQCQKDIEVQFSEDNYEESFEDYVYKFKMLKPEEIEDYLSSTFGEYFGDECEHSYMKKIIKSIENKGLDYPAVGYEGNHRALACWYLHRDLPYLEFVKKSDDDEIDDEIDSSYNS